MSTNIVPFTDFASLPAVYGEEAFSLNAAAEEFASAKFPVISTKSNRFHVKREGERVLITREKIRPTDPDEPASYIDMTVLNLHKSKTFYLEGYVEGSEEKPDCTSADGIKPDVGSKNPQCSSCALCPHNAWGSGKNDKGEATKGKACSDVMRLAVASPANLDDAFLLRVPPASLKNFAEASKWLSSKRVPINAAVIRISFDTDKNGVMKFEPIGGLDPATFQKANALRESDLVLSIIGANPSFAAPVPTAAPAAAQVAAPAPAPATKPAAQAAPAVDPAEAKRKAAAEAKAKKLAEAKAALEAAEREAAEAEAAEAAGVATTAAPVAQPATATPVVTSSSLDAELDALLKS